MFCVRLDMTLDDTKCTLSRINVNPQPQSEINTNGNDSGMVESVLATGTNAIATVQPLGHHRIPHTVVRHNISSLQRYELTF